MGDAKHTQVQKQAIQMSVIEAMHKSIGESPGTSTPNQWQSGNARNWKTGGARFKPRSRLST